MHYTVAIPGSVAERGRSGRGGRVEGDSEGRDIGGGHAVTGLGGQHCLCLTRKDPAHEFRGVDAKDGRVRQWIAERADLIGAARLPNTAFAENAGTSFGSMMPEGSRPLILNMMRE